MLATPVIILQLKTWETFTDIAGFLVDTHLGTATIAIGTFIHICVGDRESEKLNAECSEE